MNDKIHFEKVSFRYHEATDLALEDFNLKIRPGEFVAVLGHNGSGKSTMAKLINALLLPTEGLVLVDGMSTQNHEQVWQIRESVGMVFQNPDNQIIATIVEEDVAFGPENLGVPSDEIKVRVEQALQRVHMWEYRRRPPHLLSGGQKQRISIAGVLAMRPSCIVFDEPTAMLDPAGRKEVIDTLLSLKEEGITRVLITHFMEEAALADRVVVMHEGKFLISGEPKEIFKQANLMLSHSLDVPEPVKIAHALRHLGIPLSEDILDREQLVNAICQYASGT